MCIQVESIEVLKEDTTVWKTVRHPRQGNWFLSYFPPAWRAPQGKPHQERFRNIWQGLNEFYGSEGRTKRYTVGTLHRSKAPGMYCFKHYKQAVSFANRGYSRRPVLRCTIPAGTEVVTGLYEGGNTIVTPLLRVEREVEPLASS